MAKARALDRRRRSIRNIRKITRTMELISRAQFKRAMDRASAATAFTRRITALVTHLAHAGLEVSHPLLKPRPEVHAATLLVLTANRGLCGGYNAGVMRIALARRQEWLQRQVALQLEVSGRRGISALRFRGIPADQAYTHLQEKVRFEDIEVLAARYLDAFAAGQLDRLEVAYTKFESLSRQHAVVETLLPIGELAGGAAAEEEAVRQYDFLPSAAGILDEVVPASFRVRLFKCFLDAAVSEQIARMVAMKAATENADQMIQSLSMAYNRARQGQITGELLEIIGGAEALNE
jgi:F-type H+-transporting ATPase subunit gamma